MVRIGIDLGGTKTEVAALGPDGRVLLLRREHPLGAMVGVYNFSEETVMLPAYVLREVLGDHAHDRLSGSTFSFDRPTVRLDPYRALWLVATGVPA